MEVPKELEITEAQRTPGLKNPLTQEQVDWIQEETSSQFVGTYCPQAQRVQTLATEALKAGANLKQILDLALDDF
ncbi:hypothetical protein FACS1894184_14710 [Clostridia bacterium]|nr:hypothetical protein FACS1894184_14710 [Clostridia bacterium]